VHRELHGPLLKPGVSSVIEKEGRSGTKAKTGTIFQKQEVRVAQERVGA
jgi:hypothetical protein